LKLSDLIYVEVWQARVTDKQILDPSIKFDEKSSERDLLLQLGREFYAKKGDKNSYLQIMMEYYKTCQNCTE